MKVQQKKLLQSELEEQTPKQVVEKAVSVIAAVEKVESRIGKG